MAIYRQVDCDEPAWTDVKFDLFYELSMPPLLARDEPRMLEESLAEIAAADALGFNGVWLVEHHFMPGYSHSSKPELVLAACAARTQRLRLGLAIIPLPYHHPVHVAERIATLDLLSAGRVEVGIGRGFSPSEYGTFGVRMEDSRSLVSESLAILRASFGPGPVRHAGRHFRLDGLEIVPRAVQQPHPPLWTAAVSPESYDWAAREGLGVLVGPFKPWFMAEADIERYRAAWTHPEPPRIGMTVGRARSRRPRSPGSTASCCASLRRSWSSSIPRTSITASSGDSAGWPSSAPGRASSPPPG
jgi:alkanesulfonate monooxygenase SsuD/methylene tetrahydromethanopterin reductase-like flavin-dependent oxidoreductase (luciferase family)